MTLSKNEPILDDNYDEDDESHDSEVTTLLDHSDMNNNESWSTSYLLFLHQNTN